MKFNIKGHKTADGNLHLCKTCVHGMYTEGHKQSEALTYCQMIEQPIHMRVSDCSSHLAKGTLGLSQMERMAWRIGTNKKTKKIGFYTPQDYTRQIYNNIDPEVDFGPDD